MLFFSQNESAAVHVGDNLLASSPQSTRFFAWYVTSLAKTGKLDVAYSKAASLLKDQPDSKWAQFAIAGALMWSMPKTGNGKEIKNAARIAYEKDRGNPDFLWLYAESLRLVGDGNAALSLLDENEHIAAEAPDLMNVRAAILAKKTIQSNFVTSDLLSAVSESERIRSLAPENVNAYYYPGLLLLQAGYPNKAEELLLVATKYSSGYRVVAAYWEAIRAQDTLSLSEKRKRVEQSVRMLLTNDYIDRNLLVLAAEHYADLEMPESQRKLEAYILQDSPNDSIAERLSMNKIRRLAAQESRDESEYRAALRQFLDRPVHHEDMLLQQALRMKFDSFKGDNTVDSREILELVRAMSDVDGIPEVIAHTDGVLELASRKAYLKEAEALALSGFELLSKYPVQEAQLTDTGDKILTHPIEGKLRHALGWVYFNMGRPRDAERELQLVYDSPVYKYDATLLLHLGELYESMGEAEHAESYFLRCAALPQTKDHPCNTVMRDYYYRLHGSLTGVEKYLREISSRLEPERSERIAVSALAKQTSPPPFNLRSVHGGSRSSSEFEGKMLILKFWGRWCDACMIEMPVFAAYASRFEDSSDVAVVTINNDPNPGATRDWMMRNNYDFAVLLDDNYISQLGLKGIPTAWFIDRDGSRVFEVVGTIANLEEEYDARLEYLRDL